MSSTASKTPKKPQYAGYVYFNTWHGKHVINRLFESLQVNGPRTSGTCARFPNHRSRVPAQGTDRSPASRFAGPVDWPPVGWPPQIHIYLSLPVFTATCNMKSLHFDELQEVINIWQIFEQLKTRAVINWIGNPFVKCHQYRKNTCLYIEVSVALETV